MGFLRHLGIVALIAGIVMSDAALAQDLSTAERRALSAKEADRTARRDILSILEPTGKVSSGMFRMLHGISFTTKPYATLFRGLCRRDVVSMQYGPVVPREKGEAPEDAPLRPYGLESAPLYHVNAGRFRQESDKRLQVEPFDPAAG